MTTPTEDLAEALNETSTTSSEPRRGAIGASAQPNRSHWGVAKEAAQKARESASTEHTSVKFKDLYPELAVTYRNSSPHAGRVHVALEVERGDQKSLQRNYTKDGASSLIDDVTGELNGKPIPKQPKSTVQQTTELGDVVARHPGQDAQDTFNNTSTIGLMITAFPDGAREFLAHARSVFEFWLLANQHNRGRTEEEKEEQAGVTSASSTTKRTPPPGARASRTAAAGGAEEHKEGERTGVPEGKFADHPGLAVLDDPLWKLTTASTYLTQAHVEGAIAGLSTAVERDNWFHETVAQALIESAGGDYGECGIMGVGDTVYYQAVGVLTLIYKRIAQKEETIIINRRKQSQNAYDLAQEARRLLQNDVFTMMGGMPFVQACYDNTYKYLRMLFNNNPTPEIKEYMNEQSRLTAEEGSIIGAEMGVIERGADCTGVITQRITGTGTTVQQVRQGVQVLRDTIPEPGDTCTKYVERLVADFTHLRSVAGTVAGGEGYLQSTVQNGDFVLDYIAAKALADTDPMGSPCRIGSRVRHLVEGHVCEMMNDLPLDQRNMKAMLARTIRLKEELQRMETTTYSSTKRYYKKGSKKTLAAVLSQGSAAAEEEEEGEADDDSSLATDSTTSTEDSQTDLLMKAVIAIAAQVGNQNNQGQGQGNGNGGNRNNNRNGNRGPERFQEVRARGYVTELVRSLPSACFYCNGKWHKAALCGAYAWDVDNGQKYAHASDEFIEHRKSQGDPKAVRPAAGTFKKWHGRTQEQSSGGNTNGNGTNSGGSTNPNVAALNTENQLDKIMEELQKMNNRITENEAANASNMNMFKEMAAALTEGEEEN